MGYIMRSNKLRDPGNPVFRHKSSRCSCSSKVATTWDKMKNNLFGLCLQRGLSPNDQQCLVGGIPTPLKNMNSSVGMTCPIYGKIKAMFYTTNQFLPMFHHEEIAWNCLTLSNPRPWHCHERRWHIHPSCAWTFLPAAERWISAGSAPGVQQILDVVGGVGPPGGPGKATTGVFLFTVTHRIHVCYIWWHLPSIYPKC